MSLEGELASVDASVVAGSHGREVGPARLCTLRLVDSWVRQCKLCLALFVKRVCLLCMLRGDCLRWQEVGACFNSSCDNKWLLLSFVSRHGHCLFWFVCVGAGVDETGCGVSSGAGGVFVEEMVLDVASSDVEGPWRRCSPAAALVGPSEVGLCSPFAVHCRGSRRVQSRCLGLAAEVSGVIQGVRMKHVVVAHECLAWLGLAQKLVYGFLLPFSLLARLSRPRSFTGCSLNVASVRLNPKLGGIATGL